MLCVYITLFIFYLCGYARVFFYFYLDTMPGMDIVSVGMGWKMPAVFLTCTIIAHVGFSCACGWFLIGH